MVEGTLVEALGDAGTAQEEVGKILAGMAVLVLERLVDPLHMIVEVEGMGVVWD